MPMTVYHVKGVIRHFNDQVYDVNDAMIDKSSVITYIDEGLSLQKGHKSIKKCVYRGTQDFVIYDKKVGKNRCCSAVPLGFIVL